MTADPIPWAAGLLDTGHTTGHVPLYGSQEWDALPDNDPAKLASAIRAAECWRRGGEPDAVAEHLRTELEESDRLIAERMFLAHADADTSGIKNTIDDLINDVPKPGHPPAKWIRYYERQAQRVQVQMRAAHRRRAEARARRHMPPEERATSDDPNYAYLELRRRQLRRMPLQLLQHGIDQLGAAN